MKRDSSKHPFVYTQKGHLDLSWLILVVCMAAGLLGFFLDSISLIHISHDAWIWFTAFTGLCFIAGAARDRASILANATMPSSIASSLANVIREHGASTHDIPIHDDAE